MDIGEKVLELRKAQGLTQQQLAEKSGLSLRTVQRIEKGETQPYGHSLRALATALGKSTEHLQSMQTVPSSLPEEALKWMNLSALLGLAIPYMQLVVPIILYRKSQNHSLVQEYGGRIISFQILWSLFTYGMLILVGLTQGRLISMGVVPRAPWILVVYLGMAVWHITQTLRMAKRLQAQNYALFYSRIPKFF